MTQCIQLLVQVAGISVPFERIPNRLLKRLDVAYDARRATFDFLHFRPIRPCQEQEELVLDEARRDVERSRSQNALEVVELRRRRQRRLTRPTAVGEKRLQCPASLECQARLLVLVLAFSQLSVQV